MREECIKEQKHAKGSSREGRHDYLWWYLDKPPKTGYRLYLAILLDASNRPCGHPLSARVFHCDIAKRKVVPYTKQDIPYYGDQKAGYPTQGGAYPPPQAGAYPPPGQAGGYPPQQPGSYPPQQPGYPAQPLSHQTAHHTTTVIATQPGPVIVTGAAFGEIPVSMTCPRCQAQIVTSTVYQDGSFAWLMAAILCFIGCWPCCLIPFCLDGCKDVSHHCPNCRSHLGTYRRM